MALPRGFMYTLQKQKAWGKGVGLALPACFGPRCGAVAAEGTEGSDMDFVSAFLPERATIARLAGVALLCGALLACSSKKDVEDFIETPADVLYNQGIAFLQNNNFEDAAKKFEQLDKEHPYSRLDQKALIMACFTRYRQGSWDDAISAGKRFQTLYPGLPDAAYAQFLVMDSYFQQIPDVTHDQAQTQKAIDAANELIEHYPDSEYVNAAHHRLDVARDQLAGKEMETGRYYLMRRNYIGAINRFKTVVIQYQRTREIEEALERLTEAYYALGIIPEAQTAAAVLGHNYPESRWYKDAYALLANNGLRPQGDSNSWMAKAFNILKF